jgi:transcriptional regulator with XRE-family HTH domain
MEKRKYGQVKKWADELGINRIYLSAVLRGSENPSIELSFRIAKVTGISVFKIRKDLKSLIQGVPITFG